ncbi:acyl-CoA thioester hydrolase/BAAT C-terminal domain-containing protein [Winogradskyella sp. PG-2]|uniref:acyl-CoA thioester hydrolase/BAAT C-terminal domain-containing protein n=1 Tax=Winogradskyella sp. PG-2 TaxID=754409 RepID=UPI0004587748|nr:acyl-CoA thioester hydrolase/BAAT C-terminal domain-containing protein [Winogradskyella sp. PG-2]BAO76858.1 cytosolic acyl coenzyme A thioester hydrolase, inducible [Winogradskyella sp. PG-2]
MRINRKLIISIGVIAIIIISYLVIDSILFNGIKPKPINENGFQVNFFAKENIENKTAVVLIGGGQWGDYWSQEIANKEMVGISLPYIGKEGLPNLPEEIDLEYFESALNWIRKQKSVDPKKIIVMGASRNAELALIIASIFPDMVSGVIAYTPSSVSWSNTVLPYNSNELKASWKYNGIDIPYLPMTKISGNDTEKIRMLDYWENGLSKIDSTHKSHIKVELIKGPILLFSGVDDKVWPSAKMADMIENRLTNNNFKYNFKSIKYQNAGHSISTNPKQLSDLRIGKININGKNYEYEFGGTAEGDLNAKKNAYLQVFEFLLNIKND